MLETLNCFLLVGLINSGAIDVKMDGSVLEEKSCFKMFRLSFSSKLDWGFYAVSVVKTASKKIGALFPSMKSLSPEIALCHTTMHGALS